MFLLSYLLAFSMIFAMGGFTAWHLYLICTAQTTIEYYIHQDSKESLNWEGGMVLNEYDLGTWRNIRVFFNIGFGQDS